MSDVLVLALPPKLIEKARPAVEQEVAWQPDGWMGLGARGKLRRYEGDRAGLADLKLAGDRYLQVFEGRNPNLLIPANLYRLAGNQQAEPLMRRLRDDLTASVAERGPDGVRNGRLVYVHFLLQEDEQCQQVWRGLQHADPASARGTGFEPVARLAHARTSRDAAACDEAISALEQGVAKNRNSFTSPGDPGWYDWLEIALIVQAELTGRPSPRLREI